MNQDHANMPIGCWAAGCALFLLLTRTREMLSASNGTMHVVQEQTIKSAVRERIRFLECDCVMLEWAGELCNKLMPTENVCVRLIIVR